jgi:hypothetical protein
MGQEELFRIRVHYLLDNLVWIEDYGVSEGGTQKHQAYKGGKVWRGSSSKRGIRESSICNLGFCLLQIGQVKAAKEVYENVLRQYPENTIAKIQLRTINALTTNSL